MEAVARRQDADAAGATAGQLDRSLDRFGAAVGEYNVGQANWSNRQKLLGEFALRGGNRRDGEIWQPRLPRTFQRLPNRVRAVSEWYGTELRDAVGVANSVRVEQIASLSANEDLVEAKSLIEESLVGRDVSHIGILLRKVPVLNGSQRDNLAIEKRAAAGFRFR